MLKRERVRRRTYATREEAKADIFDYIEVFYNRFRKHASLGYKNPIQMEENFLPPMGGYQEAACLTHN